MSEPTGKLPPSAESDPAAQMRVERARVELSRALGSAADTVRRNTGLRLGPIWVLPLIAAAAGASAALLLRRAMRDRQRD